LSPERYLLLREGLKKINKVINLGNAAHVANQRLFSTPNIYSRGGLRNVMKAGDAWMAVSSQLETLTPDEEHEIDGLEGARRVLDVAVAAWLRFLTESGDAIVAGGGDAEHMRAISDYASGETVAGMALLNGAAKDAVASICKIASDDPACFLNSPEDLPS
jgi:hypothetical protein